MNVASLQYETFCSLKASRSVKYTLYNCRLQPERYGAKSNTATKYLGAMDFRTRILLERSETYQPTLLVQFQDKQTYIHTFSRYDLIPDVRVCLRPIHPYIDPYLKPDNHKARLWEL